MARLRAIVCVAAIVSVTCVLAPAQMAAVRLRLRAAQRIPVLWHRTVLRICGLRITEHGRPAAGRPLLILSNHASWLDIPVIGSRMPLSFIAKAEVEVEKAFPDYKAVTAPVQARMAEAAQAAQRGDQNAARWLQSILMDENPPLKAYMIGRWESARAQGIPPQSPTLAQPPASPQSPMRGTPPALPRGTQVQGSSNNETPESAKVANMSVEEYAAWRAKNPALVKRYLRGQD